MGFSNEIVVDMETGVEIVVGTRVLLEETAIVAKHKKGGTTSAECVQLFEADVSLIFVSYPKKGFHI